MREIHKDPFYEQIVANKGTAQRPLSPQLVMINAGNARRPLFTRAHYSK